MPDDGVVDDVREAMSLRQPVRMPVLALSEELDVKWYGRYSYEEVYQDGEKMA